MNIKKRLLPAALIVIVTIGCILLSRFTRALFFMALAVMSAEELEKILREAELPVDKWIWGAYIILHTGLCFAGAPVLWMITLFLLAAFLILLRGILQPSLGGKYAISALFGLAWPFAFYAVVIHAAASEAWPPVLMIAILGAWACDSMALIGGKAWGKHKLAPAVSPNKTWEGAITGGVSALLAGFLICLILRPFTTVPVLPCAITAFVASCFGQVGDLAASLIKRMAGVKDYGHLMPEHGGIMDKMDSMLFAIPAAYLSLYLFGVI